MAFSCETLFCDLNRKNNVFVDIKLCTVKTALQEIVVRKYSKSSLWSRKLKSKWINIQSRDIVFAVRLVHSHLPLGWLNGGNIALADDKRYQSFLWDWTKVILLKINHIILLIKRSWISIMMLFKQILIFIYETFIIFISCLLYELVECLERLNSAKGEGEIKYEIRVSLTFRRVNKKKQKQKKKNHAYLFTLKKFYGSVFSLLTSKLVAGSTIFMLWFLYFSQFDLKIVHANMCSLHFLQ